MPNDDLPSVHEDRLDRLLPVGTRDRYVDPCPDWCTEDHEQPTTRFWRRHGSDRLVTPLELHDGWLEDEGVYLATARLRLLRYVRERDAHIVLSLVDAASEPNPRSGNYRFTPSEAVRVASDLLHFADIALGHVEAP